MHSHPGPRSRHLPHDAERPRTGIRHLRGALQAVRHPEEGRFRGGHLHLLRQSGRRGCGGLHLVRALVPPRPRGVQGVLLRARDMPVRGRQARAPVRQRGQRSLPVLLHPRHPHPLPGVDGHRGEGRRGHHGRGPQPPQLPEGHPDLPHHPAGPGHDHEGGRRERRPGDLRGAHREGHRDPHGGRPERCPGRVPAQGERPHTSGISHRGDDDPPGHDHLRHPGHADVHVRRGRGGGRREEAQEEAPPLPHPHPGQVPAGLDLLRGRVPRVSGGWRGEPLPGGLLPRRQRRRRPPAVLPLHREHVGHPASPGRLREGAGSLRSGDRFPSFPLPSGEPEGGLRPRRLHQVRRAQRRGGYL